MHNITEYKKIYKKNTQHNFYDIHHMQFHFRGQLKMWFVYVPQAWYAGVRFPQGQRRNLDENCKKTMLLTWGL